MHSIEKVGKSMMQKMRRWQRSNRSYGVRRKNRLCINNNGVAGFFEDLPKLLFILFAVGLFVTNTIIVYGAYNRFNESTLMLDNLNNFSNEILNWNNITLSQEGVLNGRAFNNTDIDDWKYQFTPELKHFEYQILLLDRSEYIETIHGDRQNFGPINTEDRPIGVDVYSKSTPVVVEDADGNYRASFLVVAIWR